MGRRFGQFWKEVGKNNDSIGYTDNGLTVSKTSEQLSTGFR